jgi:S1-C subfamily serine protease
MSASVTSINDLAAALPYPRGQLLYLARHADARYRSFSVAKRSGGTRHIQSPEKPLRDLQRAIATFLIAAYPLRQSVHGFAIARSILTNASAHMGARSVLNLDLANYFPSIHPGRVVGALQAHPFCFPRDVAKLVASICCTSNALPQGAPSSPILANIVTWSLDRDLERLAKKYRCYYTRYADDLTLSSTRTTFPPELAIRHGASTVLGRELVEVVRKAGFIVNDKKTRLSGPNHRHVVTGLVLGERINLQRVYIREIRGMLHAWQRYGLPAAQAQFEKAFLGTRRPKKAPPDLRAVLAGKLAFVAQIRSPSDPVLVSLAKQFKTLDPNYPLPQYRAPVGLAERLRDALYILEYEGDEYVQGTGFALDGIGVVTCAHCLHPKIKAFRESSPSVKHDVEVVARDNHRDLAVLKILGTTDAIPLACGGSNEVDLLDQVYVAGFPKYGLGDKATIKQCAIANRRVRHAVQEIVLTTGIVSGMSGGPLVSSSGRVIGVAAKGADASVGHNEELADVHAAIAIEQLHALLGEKGKAVSSCG